MFSLKIFLSSAAVLAGIGSTVGVIHKINPNFFNFYKQEKSSDIPTKEQAIARLKYIWQNLKNKNN